MSLLSLRFSPRQFNFNHGALVIHLPPSNSFGHQSVNCAKKIPLCWHYCLELRQSICLFIHISIESSMTRLAKTKCKSSIEIINIDLHLNIGEPCIQQAIFSVNSLHACYTKGALVHLIRSPFHQLSFVKKGSLLFTLYTWTRMCFHSLGFSQVCTNDISEGILPCSCCACVIVRFDRVLLR